MKKIPIIGPLLLASALAVGSAAAWLLVASFISAALLPVDPQDSVAGSTLNAVLVPSFGMFAFTQFLMVPLGIKAYHTVGVSSIGTLDQFVANCNAMWNVSRVPLVILFAFSVVLAILCYRRHRRIAERSSLLWALFVFLLGAPGFIGYELHRRWPVREKCQHCGAITPRDRDACLDCGTEFPLPPLKGIEIFA